MIHDVNIAPPDERRVRATRTANAAVPVGLTVLILGLAGLDFVNQWLALNSARSAVTQLQTQLERTAERTSPQDQAAARRLEAEFEALVTAAPEPSGVHQALNPILGALHGADQTPPELWVERIVITQASPGGEALEDGSVATQTRVVLQGQSTQPTYLQQTLAAIEAHEQLTTEPSDTRRNGRLYEFTLDITHTQLQPTASEFTERDPS